MNAKIELTEREIEVIKMQLDGKLELFTGQDDEMDVICEIIDKAMKLMHELEAYDESGDDTIEWYYNLYIKQQESE